MQESKSARHEAAADLQRSCEEVSHLQQQMFDLRQGVLEPLQAEHAAMLAALGAVRRLCAELAPAASAQPADPAHLMAPSVHPAAESASLHGSADTSSNSPEVVVRESATAAEAAEAAERAVRDSLERAQQATAALADAKRLAEVQFPLLPAKDARTIISSPFCKASVIPNTFTAVGLSSLNILLPSWLRVWHWPYQRNGELKVHHVIKHLMARLLAHAGGAG